jgi:hypothetical protein
MGASVVDAFLRGQRAAWIGLFVVVAVALVSALAQRGPRTSPGKVLLLSALVSGLAAGGILVATALAVPRITWRRTAPPPYASAAGDVWRTLRAPATALLLDGRPEIGLAGVDRAGKVQLYGLFSGAPIDGLPDAPPSPPLPGGARICHSDKEECRAWPDAWPEPAPAPSGSDLVWRRELFTGALAYDVDSGLFLDHIEGMRGAGSKVAMAGGASAPAGKQDRAGAWALEQVGKLSNEPSREGPTALFVVRRIAADRLDAVRVVGAPAGESFAFSVERATVSLTAAPRAFRWVARPILLALVLWFPLATLLLQAAPAWWASRRRKRLAEGQPLEEMPADAAAFSAAARQAMAQKLHGPAVLAVGLALAAPAVMAVVAVVAAR